MLTMYTPDGKAVNVDKEQIPLLQKNGWNMKKPGLRTEEEKEAAEKAAREAEEDAKGKEAGEDTAKAKSGEKAVTGGSKASR